MSEQIIRSGFVSLIGRPNVGKSTLLNKLVGVRLAITSPKPQTTRQVVRGIIDDENSQIIFLDTPGFHAPRTRLGEYMVQAATTALADGDIALLLVDAEKATGERAYPGIPSIEADIMQKADNMNKKVILVLNKVDRVVKEALLPLMALYASAFDFAAIVPISAKTGDGLDRLISEIRQLLPEGPRYYPVDSLTDQTERGLCAELIREQVLLLTSEEIPYGVAVEIESFTALADDNEPQRDDAVTERNLVRIGAVIYCNKDSHKGILIGNRGSMLKNIGSRARGQIEAMLGCPCYLELHVKVREDWRNRRGILRNLGYETRN
ncbi:MAG: GTPase Era [Saccharofermentanales bacterium]|jgi:GTP-binding protein Era|nr:GTPase Era [Clostridiaceae bacterium]